MHREVRHRASIVLALALGSAPSLIVPIAVVQQLPVNDSSTILLAYSISAIVTALFGNTIETTTLANISAIYATSKFIASEDLCRIAVKCVKFSFLPCTILYAILIAVYWHLSSELALPDLFYAGILVCPIPVILAWSSVYSGELFARQKLTTVYISGLARGVPPLLASLVLPSVVSISSAYLLGESIRALFIWKASTRTLFPSEDLTRIPFRIKDMGKLCTSNIIGQLMPALMQAMFALTGANAISQGAIALRVQAAATQITTGGLTMHNVSRFASKVIGTDKDETAIRRVLITEAIRVTTTACAVAILAVAGVVIGRIVLAGVLSPTVLAGLGWSLVLIAAIPTVALTFWAGRGLIIAGFHKPLPVVIAVASLFGSALGLALLPIVGGLSALIASAACSTITAIGYTHILLRSGPPALAKFSK